MPVHIVRAGKPVDPANVMSQSPTAPDLVSSFAHATDLCLPDHAHFIPMEVPDLTAQWIQRILEGASRI